MRINFFNRFTIADVSIPAITDARQYQSTGLRYNLLILDMWMVVTLYEQILTLQSFHPYGETYHKRCRIYG